MKKLLLTLFAFINLASNATTYYIDPTGNDATGNGTLSNPWLTLHYATQTVNTAGDIIHVNAGIYLETQQCFLAAGVNLEGDGISSIIQSTWSWSYQGALVLNSPIGTNGNQSVSYLKFDGRNETTPRGIEIQGRSHVSIHHCTIVDFKEEGVIFNGDVSFTSLPPSIYAVGNTFHDNILTNCSQFAGFGTGCLGIGGQQDMLIYNNTITQLLRTQPKQIGWPIKYYNEGWLKGVKIYNNTITKAPHNGQGWNFALEIFNFQGLEIYDNTIYGSLDFNFQGDKGTYPWVCHIHDNVIGQPTLNLTNEDQGLIFEYDVDGAIVENNIFRNLTTGLSFYCRPGTSTKDFVLQKNLFDNIGYSSQSFSYFIGGFDAGTNDYKIDNFKVLNNTFIGNNNPSLKPNGTISMGSCNTGYIKNIDIRNNHIENAVYPPFVIAGTATKDNVNISNNNLINTDQYGIGSSGGGTPYFPNGTPTNYTTANNIAVVPLFVSGNTYALQATSPLIDAGINIGLPYSGSAPDIGYLEYSALATSIASINDNSGIFIYPNPSNNFVTIQLNNTSAMSIELFDVLGNVVMTEKTNDRFITISLRDLTKGVYIVKINTENNSVTKKIIKE